MRARHRLSKLLLRQGLVWQQSAWTHAQQRWLEGLGWDQPGVRVALDEALEAVLSVQARRDRLDGVIVELATQPAWAPLVSRLGCRRGSGC
jgi:transposase